MRHPPCETLPRHRHREAFAAVVLAGGYDEAGDTGRHRVQAGDVIFHRAFESHLDRFGAPGAEVLVIPLARDWAGLPLGTVADPDAIARTAELDPCAALEQLTSGLQPCERVCEDWPERLASALRQDPSLCLTAWAAAAGLHPGSLARGFVQVFGSTPSAYRLVRRTHLAIEAIARSPAPLSRIALDCGFADQAHMSRAVVRLTGLPPARLRGSGALLGGRDSHHLNQDAL
jgi:AraC-like DNA-binding protein